MSISNYLPPVDNERTCDGVVFEREREGFYLIQLCISRETVVMSFEKDLAPRSADVFPVPRVLEWRTKWQINVHIREKQKQLLAASVMKWFVFHHFLPEGKYVVLVRHWSKQEMLRKYIHHLLDILGERIRSHWKNGWVFRPIPMFKWSKKCDRWNCPRFN